MLTTTTQERKIIHPQCLDFLGGLDILGGIQVEDQYI